MKKFATLILGSGFMSLLACAVQSKFGFLEAGPYYSGAFIIMILSISESWELNK